MGGKKTYKNAGMMASFYYKGTAVGYEGTGNRFVDERTDGEPMRTIVGSHKVPQGIEEALMEMEIGEERNLIIPPEKGYYLRNEKDVQWYPKAMLPDGYNLHLHSQLFWTNPADKTRKLATVVEETKDQVKIDLNHPFAGRELHYWIKLVDLM